MEYISIPTMMMMMMKQRTPHALAVVLATAVVLGWMASGAVAATATGESHFVVTATTPLLHRREGNPLASDKGRQAPYVHWTCHDDESSSDPADAAVRNSPSSSLEKRRQLQCCQAIYRTMSGQPTTVCWKKKGGCSTGASDRSEFIQHCTSQLAFIHLPSYSSTATTTDNTRVRRTVPRYTLLLAPEGMTLDIRTWGQVVDFGSDDNVKWFYDGIRSPVSVAKDAARGPADGWHPDDDNQNDDRFKKPTLSLFELQFTTQFAAHQDRDQERYLRHILRWSFPTRDSDTEPWLLMKSYASATPSIYTWSTQATVLLFLPEGVALASDLAGSLSSSSSSASCQISETGCASSCNLQILPLEQQQQQQQQQQTSRKTSTRTSLAAFDVVTLRVIATPRHGDDTICQQDPTNNNNSSTATISISAEWMTKLLLEDDESYLMAAPIVHDSQLIRRVADADDDDKNTVQAVWDEQGAMGTPFLTNVEDAWWSDEL
jgi:hypothetical protein